MRLPVPGKIIALLSLSTCLNPAWAADRAVANSPFQKQLNQCRELVGKRHLDRAKPAISRLLDQQPNNADLWVLMAVCELEPAEDIERHHAEARRCLNKALSINPQLGEAYYYLSELESYSENWTATRGYATKATTVKEPDKTAYRLCAAACNALGKEKEALDAINKYIEFRPRATDGPPIKAAVLENSGNYAEADKVYKAMLAEKLMDKYVLADAKCLVKLGRTNDAIAVVSRLLSVNAHDEVALRERAKLYKQAGKYNDAIKDLSASIDEVPSSAAYRERADLYKKINRMDLCKKDLASADAQ
jgi:tetratricopeptide (TPR) repeat protein